MNQRPIFCSCGRRLVEKSQETGHDPYTGKMRYSIYLICPKYGKFLAGNHDRWDYKDEKWEKYFNWDV